MNALLRSVPLRCIAMLWALVVVGCGGGEYIGNPSLALAKSFRISASPAEITIAAGTTASATLELNCIFNRAVGTIDVSVTNGTDLARSQLVVPPRRADRACEQFSGVRNAAGEAIYEGTVSWPITVLDDALPGRYAVEFLAENNNEGIANTERTSLVIIVTAPQPAGFSLVVPADALLREVAQPSGRPQHEAEIPIAVARADHAGVIDVETSGIDGDGAVSSRFFVGTVPPLVAGETNTTTRAHYQAAPRPGDRAIISARGGGVTRTKAVRLRSDAVVPLAPANFTAAATTASVALRWHHDRAATSYRLERALDEAGPFTTIATLVAPTAAHTDTGVQPETSYVYRLHAINEHGSSAPAQTVATTFALPVLSVTVHGRGSVRSEPAGIDCGIDCSDTYAVGSVVRLVAAPDAGQSSGHFSGDADCSDGSVTLTRAIACTVTFVPAAGSGWQQLGSALTDRSTIAPSFSLAIDDDFFAAPVVAYVESTPRGDPARLHVKRLNGIVWETLGAGALNAGSTTAASDPSLATRLGSPPHVAWSQGNGTQQNVFVARFVDGAWQSVGAPGVPLNYRAGSRAVRPSLALDVNGQPQLAWIEDGAVKWKRFDGANWVPSRLAGEGPVSSEVADRVRLATTPYAPVLAWTEGPVNDRKLKVTNGESFPLLGVQANAPYNVPVTITHFGLRPEENGAIVFWTQDERPFSVHARRWDGSFWADYGAPPVNVESNLLLSFAVARRTNDVAFTLQPPATAAFTSLFQRSGSDWFAPPALTGVVLRGIEVEVPRNDAPVVAGFVLNAAELFELRVYRYFP